MLFTFLLGVVVGIAIVAFVLWVIVYDPYGPVVENEPFIDQFRPIQVPEELRNFLKTGKDGLGISEWESCHSLSLFLHMFYQEHKDTRQLRRWMHKRLQMELNDIATRSAAGRFLQEIRIRDLSLGTKFPCLNCMRVEKVEMSEDKTIFESITFLLNVEYTGGFETSVDVTTAIAKANLSIKITKLAGLVRLILSRKPYNHWTMSFVSTPEFETDVSSAVSGHQLKRLIPLIKESIKRALQRKHVWPNYKIRYRPVFPNPLLQPSPPLSAFAHVKLEGGLEITVLKCTRLKVDLLEKEANWDVYCTLGMDQRPFLQNNSQNVAHSLSVMLVFSRYDLAAPVGVTFEKLNATATPSVGHRPVRVGSIAPGSLADKAMIKPGDTFVAINNVPIRSERQVARFLEQTLGDLMVLVDRNLDDMDDEEFRETEEIIGDPNGDPDDAFVALGCVKGGSMAGMNSPLFPGQAENEDGELRNGQRRHSLSAEPSSSSMFGTTESINSSIHSLLMDGKFEETLTSSTGAHLVQRAESARVPHVLVSQPSMDLRRTRSESQLDMKTGDSSSTVVPSPAPEQFDVEEEVTLVNIRPLNREAPLSCSAPQPSRKEELLLGEGEGGKMTRGASSASIHSSVSAKTDVTDEAEEEGVLSRDRPASSRRHRLQATFQAGKRKMMEFTQKKRATTSNEEPIEVGADACDAQILGEKSDSGSPAHTASSGKRSPVELKVVDKVEKKERKKWRRKCNSHADLRTQDSPTASIGSIKSRTTRCTPLRENILWGQSLHFTLDSGQNGSPPGNRLPCKYLNITVHAKQNLPEGTATADEPARPILLGYTSLYIPQLIDDCALTLSNCHREVFPLKPPIGLESQMTINSSDFARHAGFDPRLCFGDITLGFRYFPQGFPEEACINAGEETEATVQNQAPNEQRPFSPPSVKPMSHEWAAWTSKNSGGSVCAMCRGKIWLKAGSCCQRCLVVCHSKCTVKANTGIVCTPQTAQDDAQFEMLNDDELNTAMVEDECPVSIIPSSEATPLRGTTLETVSRRAKLKNKVTEKFSLWRKRTKKNEDKETDADAISQASGSTTDGVPAMNDGSPGSPMASIQDCLSDVLPQLEGSPFISGLFFQPGNAYNEQTISHAKQLGKEIFADYSGAERVAKINQQIDIIQQAIRETKDGRLVAMTNKEDPSGFENLDERLQALAVVMLHYCAALQDCASSDKSSTESLVDDVNNESELPSPEEASFVLNPSGSSSSSLKTDADILSETLEDDSACRSVSESTVIDVSPPAAVSTSSQ